MREIKVRGYAVEEYTNGQWKYGTGVHTNEFTEEYFKEKGVKSETFIFTESGWVEVEKESVGQYTGLKDKNGREIYEGDLIYVSNNDGDEVSFTGVMKFEDGSYYVSVIDDALKFFRLIYYKMEVIGNICEDTHLLRST